MQSRRIALAGLGLVVVLATGLTAWRTWITRHDVPVSFDPYPNDAVDGPDVVTTLHEYYEPESDTTTGRSISFSFPANYYGYADNVEGGPQYRIRLRLHRKTWRPIVPDEQAAMWSVPLPENFKDVINELRANDLSATIFSATKSVPAVLRSLSTFRAYKAGAKPLAQPCGLVLFDEDHLEASPFGTNLSLNELINNTKIGLIGISVDSTSEEQMTAISCTRSSPICIVEAPFEDWTKSFAIKRTELCEWHSVAQRLDALLTRHVVARTTRRQPN